MCGGMIDRRIASTAVPPCTAVYRCVPPCTAQPYSCTALYRCVPLNGTRLKFLGGIIGGRPVPSCALCGPQTKIFCLLTLTHED
eukprot:scaffold64073_cov76-Cyclotella_meneghiniana.AAC.1